MKIEIKQLTSWNLALNEARETVGKPPIEKEPSDQWKAKILLAEHSPIRLVQYLIKFQDIKTWVINHLVRHHIGVEKFVHSQREDRRNLEVPRDELPQGSLNDADFVCNAQALISISRKRLCRCAHPETRKVWEEVKNQMTIIDPIMAEKMVPECVYRGFCPELYSCGYYKTHQYQEILQKYHSKHE